MVGRVLFGAPFEELSCIRTVATTQSVPLLTFPLRALIFHLLYEKQNLPAIPDQWVFIKGFRAKRILFWTKPIRAAAKPLPDDPENRREDEVEVTHAPCIPKVGCLV